MFNKVRAAISCGLITCSLSILSGFRFCRGNLTNSLLYLFYSVYKPPATSIKAPVVNDDCAEAKKYIAAATSSG